MKVTLFIIVLLVTLGFYKNLKTPKKIGVINGRLASCPWTPNCVNSYSDNPKYKIEPLTSRSENPLSQVETFLIETYKTKVISKTDNYLYAVVTTPRFHFKDDLEFLLGEDGKSINVRSSARVGYSDLGVNRARIERLRDYLNQD